MPDQGAFMSALDWLDRPGQAVRNLVRGDPDAAFRHLLDIPGKALDAVLPGDVIPDAATDPDFVSGGDLVGATDPGVGKFVADIGVGMALDPLTYTGVGFLAKGAGLAGKAASKTLTPAAERLLGAERVAAGLEKGKSVLDKTGQRVRSIFSAERLGDTARSLKDTSAAAGSLERQAAVAASRKALEGLDERQAGILGDVLDNFRWEDGKVAGSLAPSYASRLERIRAHPELLPGEEELLAKAADEAVAIGQSEKAVPGIFEAAPAPRQEYAEIGAVGSKSADALSDEYLMRVWDSPDFDPANAMMGRSLKTADEINGFIAKNPGVKFERNALRRLLKRAEGQGILAERASLGRGVLDRVRAGELELPDELVRETAAKLDPLEMPVPKPGTAAPNLDALLGGDAAVAKEFDPLVMGAPAKPAKAIKAQPDMGAMLGGTPDRVADGVMPLGAKPGARAAAPVAGEITDESMRRAREKLLSKEFVLGDEESRKIVNAVISNMPEEEAAVLARSFSGEGKRGAIMQGLATMNRFFKPYAVYGAFIPRVGSIVRNKVGAVWQAMSEAGKDGQLFSKLANDPAARNMVVGQAARFDADLVGAVADSLKMKYPRDKFADGLRALQDALSNSQGSGAKAVEILSKSHPEVAEALKAGVLDGFTRAEDIMRDMAQTGWSKKFMNWMDWPGKIFRGVEDRMRLGMFLDLRAAGKSAEEAARITSDALLDYGKGSNLNRAARDIIPFFQFSAKAIPQQAQFLANNPAVFSGVRQAMLGGRDEPVYPWMEGKVNIPLGVDGEGNFQYASGLGLPFESLGMIPGSGADVRRNVLGSAHPLIKSAYGAVSGRDPFFDSPFGSYSKLPGKIEGGAVGRAYNIVQGAGLLGPLDSPVRTIASAADPSKGLGLGALDALTGLSVRSVDPDRALAQKLDAELKQRPDVRQMQTLYAQSDDPETKALLAELRAARKKIAERKAMANTD